MTTIEELGLLKMLLESQRWSSRARYLQWRTKPVFSTRTTEFSDTDSERPLHLNASAKTLRVTDTKSSRCLFQLVPLEPRTAGKEYGLLPTVQTQGLKENVGGRSLRISPLLLPTPTAIDRGSGMVNRSLGKNAKARPTLARLVRENIPKDGGETFQLSPLYVADMMGFPLMWTVSPFLIHDGEPSR
jgi:hypothetical protein